MKKKNDYYLPSCCNVNLDSHFRPSVWCSIQSGHADHTSLDSYLCASSICRHKSLTWGQLFVYIQPVYSSPHFHRLPLDQIVLFVHRKAKTPLLRNFRYRTLDECVPELHVRVLVPFKYRTRLPSDCNVSLDAPLPLVWVYHTAQLFL